MIRAGRMNALQRIALRGVPLIMGLSLGGCANMQPATFPAAGPAIVWPRPPDPPRIRYIGEITGEASIGRSVSSGEAFRAILEGPREPARFGRPMAVAVAGSRVYVADPTHAAGPAVHVLDLAAHTYAAWREVGGAPLRWPIDVAVSNGRIAVADAERAAVFVLDAQGRTLTTIGAGVLKRPASVTWKPAGDELCVVDASAHALFAFDANGAERARWGGRGAGPGEFNYPAGVTWLNATGANSSGGGVAVADSMNFRVQLMAADHTPLHAFGHKGDAAGDFSLPRDVGVDSEGHIYVLDSQFENVQVFDAEGRLLLAFGEDGRGPGQFSVPSGITIDEQDRIWVADTYNHRVQAFQFVTENRP